MEVLAGTNAPALPSGASLSADLLPTGTNVQCRLRFGSLTNALYYLQYSGDMKVWTTAWPSLTGTGGNLEWMEVLRPPPVVTNRYYRVLLLP